MKNLYKVMIVEAKRQTVHIYKNMIPWEEYGFEVTLVTDTESAAIAFYGEYKHDLIITDIDLKVGNGISLIKKLKRIDPSCIVVVIAAHEDYDSVREAFLVGASDYLLKSRIRYSSLANVLENVKEKLVPTHLEVEQDNWGDNFEKLLGLIRDEQKIDMSFIDHMLERPEFSVLSGSYRMLYFRQDNIKIFNRMMKQYDAPNSMNTDEYVDLFRRRIFLRDEIKTKLQEIIMEFISSIPNAIVQFTKKHSGLILIPASKDIDYKGLAHTIIQNVNQRLTYECSITISSQAKGKESFIDVYKDVMTYHSHKFYDGDTCIQQMDERLQFQVQPQNLTSYEEEIIQGVLEHSFTKIEHAYLQVLEIMMKQNVYPDEVKKYFVNVIQHTEIMIEKKGIEAKYPFDILKDGIKESESIMFLSLELEKIFKTLIDWIVVHQVSKHHTKVAIMLAYVEQHLHEKIILDHVAQAARLSVTHASRMFKSDTSVSIMEYINHEKMKYAEALLHDDTKKIKEIALAVGMSDQLYFNKVFRKYYHMSPRAYKKTL